jgi:NAD(P)-dependent dehydrogenase (short-subunit alcohol dehydrogenase family)
MSVPKISNGRTRRIGERTRTEWLYAAEMETLRMITQGAGLSDILNHVCASIDRLIVPSITTILLMDPDESQRVAYQTAKSGLIGLNRHTATVGGNHGIRSNIVAPGVTLTAAAVKILNEEYRNQILASVRPTRLGVPEDIAAMVAFLLSDDAAYVNGQTILVDAAPT